jgi:4-amino-4-deoxy-L-arabinose transferase-like glycosyltransferase
MKKIFNWKKVLILIILLTAFLRLYQLGNIPYGVNGDEANYIYNAYSIWNTGKDVEGKLLPLSFNAYSSESPVVVYLTAPSVGLLGLSVFSGRLPSAILGIGSVFLLFLITDLLFKNKRLALLSALLLSISPWAIQVSRGTLLDVNFALFFLLLGIYIFMSNISSNKFLCSLIPFSLAFYSYHATKVFLVFLIPILIFFFRSELLKRKKNIAIFLGVCLILLISFLFVVKFQSVTRQQDVNLFNSINSGKQINWERNYNTAPWILREVFSNKPLYYLRIMRENFLESFSTNFLFLYGDVGLLSPVDNIGYRGEFYIIELPFLLIGIYLLIKSKNKFLKRFIFTLLLIGVLPSTVTIDKSFVNRNIMMLPILIIIISLGLNFVLNKISKLNKKYGYVLVSFIVLFYLFLFSSYLYQYYFRWPVYGAERASSSSRDLSNFIVDIKNKFSNIYLSKQGSDFLLEYGIYEKINPVQVQDAWKEDPGEISNIKIFQNCLNNGIGYVERFLPKNTLFIAPYADCHYSSTPSATIVDRGEPLHVIYDIYEIK